MSVDINNSVNMKHTIIRFIWFIGSVFYPTLEMILMIPPIFSSQVNAYWVF